MQILKAVCPKEEAEIREMHKRQSELHLVPTPLCYLDIEVQDKSGIVVTKYSDRSKSWVRNFYNWMVAQQMSCGSDILGTTYGAGTLAVKEVNGFVRSHGVYTTRLREVTSGYGYRGAAGSTTNGIVVGTGNAAESFESHILDSLIANGTGAGQLQYQEMSAPTPVWDSQNKAFTLELERIMINNSGGAIDVKEVGLIAYLIYSASNESRLLVARDVLSSSVNVPNESQIKATYTIQIVYPA